MDGDLSAHPALAARRGGVRGLAIPSRHELGRMGVGAQFAADGDDRDGDVGMRGRPNGCLGTDPAAASAAVSALARSAEPLK